MFRLLSRRLVIAISTLALLFSGSVAAATASQAGGTFCPSGLVGAQLYESVTGGYSTTGDLRVEIVLKQNPTSTKVHWTGSLPTLSVPGVQLQTVQVLLANPVTGMLAKKQFNFNLAGNWQNSISIMNARYRVYEVIACGSEYIS